MRTRKRFFVVVLLVVALLGSFLSATKAQAAPDLAITGVIITPLVPNAGENVTVTVTVTNSGPDPVVGPFVVDIYKHLMAAPLPGDVGDVYCIIGSGLLAFSSTECTKVVSYGSPGNYSMWAQVDTDEVIMESNEFNNVFGPQSILVNPIVSSQLGNISTRGMVQTGANVMIGGFIIDGLLPRTVLIRGFGPTLADFGVTGALSDPYIELYSGPTMIATNNDYQTPVTSCIAPAVCGTLADIVSTGMAACNVATTGCNKDAAIYVTLPPGAYTAMLKGVSGATGVGLVGIDDVTP